MPYNFQGTQGKTRVILIVEAFIHFVHYEIRINILDPNMHIDNL